MSGPLITKNIIPGVLKKSGTLDFRYFDIRKYSIFWFHQIKHCLLKRMYQDHFIWFSSIDSIAISWNPVINEFCSICASYLRWVYMAVNKFSLCFVCTDQWASGQQCMEVRKAIIPDWNVTRMKRKLTMTTVLWNDHRFKTIYSTNFTDLGIILFSRQCFIWWKKMLYFQI